MESEKSPAVVRLGEDGDLQAVLMMAVGRDRGRHGHWSGSHDRCARPRAVWAAARPHRAALKRRVQKFRFVSKLRLHKPKHYAAVVLVTSPEKGRARLGARCRGP